MITPVSVVPKIHKKETKIKDGSAYGHIFSRLDTFLAAFLRVESAGSVMGNGDGWDFQNSNLYLYCLCGAPITRASIKCRAKNHSGVVISLLEKKVRILTALPPPPTVGRLRHLCRTCRRGRRPCTDSVSQVQACPWKEK